MSDELYMKLALDLAKKGVGRVAPNPLVGAVVVKNGRIIGQGWHEAYGKAHAERNALEHCIENPKGATLYVTLEPCCHFGKQPPCTDLIIESKIDTVVIGSKDPNPLVAGKGIAILRQAGIKVKENLLKEACDQLNEIFFYYIQKNRPFVLMKYAMTMDGKIATHTGASKWITGEVARHEVHETRHQYQAIMVGVDTVIKDNPSLTCRLPGGSDPIRIICDSHLRSPLDSNVIKTAQEVPTWLATTSQHQNRKALYENLGCQIICTKEKDGQVDLVDLMMSLGQRGVASILLEGGSTLNWSMLKAGLVGKLHTYIAPKIFGGVGAKGPIGGEGVGLPSEAIQLKNTKLIQLEKDFLIESEVDSPCLRD